MSLVAEDANMEEQQVVPLKRSMGLINQGCTCYLNSLLQLLFHLPYFRSAVYRMTLNRSDSTSLIPQALQELFFQMQERKTAPTTKGLTDAFGWDEQQVFLQHDIQELAALLRDNLETQMRGSPSEGAINRLFEGAGEQVVETLDGTYSSRVRDTFYDIHVSVSHPNIHEAMRSLEAKDQLVGDNKYRVEEEGQAPVYKDAQKGYRFVRLPPVILFHLKRFEMDFNSPTLAMRKVNNTFEFAESVDLREFESGDNNSSSQATAGGSEFQPDSQALYDLHAVIVHKGGVDSGHYYSYIREFDAESGEYVGWLEYDDDRVTPVDSFTAVDSNFGGYRFATMQNGREVRVPVTHSAYILSYVRRADRNLILAPSPTDIIPERVKRELRRVMEADEHRHRIERERAMQIRLVLATHDTIATYVRNNVGDLMNRDERIRPQLSVLLDVPKTTKMSQVYEMISAKLGSEYPAKYIKLWRWHYMKSQPNMHYRPGRCVPEHDQEDNVMEGLGLELLDRMQLTMLLVERVVHPAQFAQKVDNHDHIRLYVKCFIPQRNEVCYVGAIDASTRHLVSSLRGDLVQMLGIKDTQLDQCNLMWESVSEGLVELDANHRLSMLSKGDILVVRLPQPGSSLQRNRSIVDVFQEARHRELVSLRNVATPHEVLAEVCVSVSWSYNKITETIANVLAAAADAGGGSSSSSCVHPSRIQLYRNTDMHTPTPSIIPVRESDDAQLQLGSLCYFSHHGNARDFSPHIFFKILPISRFEADEHCTVPAIVLNEEGVTLKRVKVEVKLTTKLVDIVRQCLAAAPIPIKEKSKTDPAAAATAATATAAEPTHIASTTSKFILTFLFESHSRPWLHPLVIDLANPNCVATLSRQLQVGEIVHVQAAPPATMVSDEDGYCSPCSSASDSGGSSPREGEGEEEKVHRREVGAPRRNMTVSVYVACGQKDYNSPSFPAFGSPIVLPITSWTTCQAVLDVLVKHFNVPEDEVHNQYPLMMSTLDLPNPRFTFFTQGSIDHFMMSDKSYCFPELEKEILPLLKASLENATVFLFVNRRHPKGKGPHAGQRYIATNDPKLSLGKK